MRHHFTWARAASAALVLASTLGLAGCGNEGPGTATSTAAPVEHNDADVDFASHMILHHQQAVQMSDIAGWQATNAGVKKLAAGIKAAQEPEMKQMAGWLRSWGEPVPSPSHGGHHLEESIAGMMTEDEMHELGQSEGAAFDRMWIQMMIRHHEGAVAMAKTEQASGKHPTAIALAKTVTTAQTTEIATMKRLLTRLPRA